MVEEQEKSASDSDSNIVGNEEQLSERHPNQPGVLEMTASAQVYQGPIPHPSILAGYENVVPGAADRILQMAEREQQHRHKSDQTLINAEIEDARQDRYEARLGQIFGLVIGLSAIITGGVTAVRGAQIAGAFISSSGVAGLAAVFIVGRNQPSSDKTQ